MKPGNNNLTIISAYPLSNILKAEVQQHFPKNTIHFISLQELKYKGLKTAYREIKNNNCTHIILNNDTHIALFLPIMIVFFFIAKPNGLYIFDLKTEPKRIGLFKFLINLNKLITSSIKNYCYYYYCRITIKNLLAQRAHVNSPPASVNNTLYINANLWFGVAAGGSIGHIAGVINSLYRDFNYQVFYASPVSNALLDTNIKILTLNYNSCLSVPYELNNYSFNYSLARQLNKYLQQNSIAFIYQRLSYANFSGPLLKKAFKLPLIIEYNGSEVWIANNWGTPMRDHKVAASIEEVCLRHADIIVTISQVLKDELISRGISANRIVCYPNCIDPLIFNPNRFDTAAINHLKQQYQLPITAKLITFVGTFGRWHGTEILAKAIRELILANTTWLKEKDIYFMLVGDGIRINAVKEILADLPNSNRIIFTGLIPQAETPKYLAAAEILVSPHISNEDGSRFFGSPTKLFEYMAMGKAIIASDLDQIGEVLKNSWHIEQLINNYSFAAENKLAILCQPGNSEQIVQAIKLLIENPLATKALGQNAYQEAIAKYTWQQHVKRIIQTLNNL